MPALVQQQLLERAAFLTYECARKETLLRKISPTSNG